MNINAITLEQALQILGDLLADRGQSYEVVAIGGGSLLLLGQIERPTKDLDLVALIDTDRFIPAKPLQSCSASRKSLRSKGGLVQSRPYLSFRNRITFRI